MKKIYFSLLIFASIFLLVFVAKAQTTATKLKIHFYTYGDDKTNFHAWLWQDKPSQATGADHKLTYQNDKWSTVEISLKDEKVNNKANSLKGATRVGIIIKSDAGWSNISRQPGGDRFINIPDYSVDSNGIVNAYFVFADAKIYKSKSDAVISDKALISYLSEDKKKIIVKATSKPDSAELLDSKKNVVESFNSIVDKNFELNITKNLILGNNYTLKLKFGSNYPTIPVSIEKLYTTKEFNDNFYYDGQLGLLYSKQVSTFKVWSPFKKQIQLFLYNQNHEDYDNQGKLSKEDKPYKKVDFVKGEKGVWTASVSGDLEGKYYTYNVISPDGSEKQIVDPYAIAVGANGTRAMVVDIDAIKPKNWTGKKPDTIKNLTDYILYEAHVRDFTTHKTWNGKDEHRGTFKGFIQSGTTYTDPKTKQTVKTGFDHILEMGVNAVHLLPIADANQVDETKLKDKEYMTKHGFNWNYMTNNFNVPDGAYSTNPFDGKQRILELKELVQKFSDNNLRLVLDVVYNHTGRTEDSNFNTLVEGYYHRRSEDGSFWNNSYTGNDTASERPMFRKFMKDSVRFWAEKYNISGFRFDIMGLHDLQTMNEIRDVVDSIDPTITLYGEPWEQGNFKTPESGWANIKNIDKIKNIGMFNPDTRDKIKRNFVSDDYYNVEKIDKILYGIWGGVKVNSNLKIDLKSSENPVNVINYVSAHDDATLRDDFYSIPHEENRELKYYKHDNDIIPRVKLANSIILTSQGIPFIHAGAEILRSKPEVPGLDIGDNRVHEGTVHNSYNAPDEVNNIKWDNKVKYYNVFNYYRSLIAIRRLYPQFRLNTAAEIRERVKIDATIVNGNRNFIKFSIQPKNDQPRVIVMHTGKGATHEHSLDKTKKYLLLVTNNNDTKPERTISPFGVKKLVNKDKLLIRELSTAILVEIKNDSIDFAENRTVDFSKSQFKDGQIQSATIVSMYDEGKQKAGTVIQTSANVNNPWLNTSLNNTHHQQNNNSSISNQETKGLSKGAIAGISLGIFALLAGISVGVFFIIKSKKK